MREKRKNNDESGLKRRSVNQTESRNLIGREVCHFRFVRRALQGPSIEQTDVEPHEITTATVYFFSSFIFSFRNRYSYSLTPTTLPLL